jgi:hypothetical protein
LFAGEPVDDAVPAKFCFHLDKSMDVFDNRSDQCSIAAERMRAHLRKQRRRNI